MTCDEPTEWCSQAFFVPKGDGKRARLVTDHTKLNKFVVRPVHPFPTVSDIIQSIPASAACFAKLDATHKYFQIPLDEEASKLTTFSLAFMRSFNTARTYMLRCLDPNFKWISPLNLLTVCFQFHALLRILIDCRL